jgi:hypothetical protein
MPEIYVQALGLMPKTKQKHRYNTFINIISQ